MYNPGSTLNSLNQDVLPFTSTLWYKIQVQPCIDLPAVVVSSKKEALLALSSIQGLQKRGRRLIRNHIRNRRVPLKRWARVQTPRGLSRSVERRLPMHGLVTGNALRPDQVELGLALLLRRCLWSQRVRQKRASENRREVLRQAAAPGLLVNQYLPEQRCVDRPSLLITCFRALTIHSGHRGVHHDYDTFLKPLQFVCLRDKRWSAVEGL